MGPRQSKQPDYWAADDDHPQCQLCETKFSMIRRRHHCRSCGGVFCAACTARTSTVPGRGFLEPVRVCDSCKLREGGAPHLPALGFGAHGSSLSGNAPPRRAQSFDVSGMGGGAGAFSDGRGAVTPRSASTFAISGGAGATTPRVGAASSANGRGAGAVAPAAIQRGQFASSAFRPSGAAASGAPGTAAAPAAATSTAPSKSGPLPGRSRTAVLLVLVRAPAFHFLASVSATHTAAIGRAILAFLRQPSTWFDRVCVPTQRGSLAGDPAADWTRLVVRYRVPSGLSAAARTAPPALALFVAAPSLPSTYATTLQLHLRMGSPGAVPLCALRSLQVGVVHETTMATRARAQATAAAASAAGAGPFSCSVEALTTTRVPAIGVSLEGRAFCGARVDPAEFFQLTESTRAVVVSVSFDQSSGAVAFSLANATPPEQGAKAAASSGTGTVLPVIAAFPCTLPSGVAGRWHAAVSLDTSQLGLTSTLVAEWL
jgi:hypothetical protein